MSRCWWSTTRPTTHQSTRKRRLSTRMASSDEDYDPTKINQHIRTLLRKFQKSAYVGYTATPFAKHLHPRQGATEKFGPDLFPRSFIVNLPAPSNYDGPIRLFGLEATSDDDRDASRFPLIRLITDHAVTAEPKETPAAGSADAHQRVRFSI